MVAQKMHPIPDKRPESRIRIETVIRKVVEPWGTYDHVQTTVVYETLTLWQRIKQFFSDNDDQ